MTNSNRPIRIAVLAPWLSPGTGYIENRLPEALARRGCDVHVIASPWHAPRPIERGIRLAWASPREPESLASGGVMVTRLSGWRCGWQVILRGLDSHIRNLKPAIVQVHSVTQLLAIQACRAARDSGAVLFAGCHLTRETIERRGERTLRLQVQRAIARYVMRDASVCYCVSEEAWRVARRDLGIADERLRLLPLGANTDLYHPPTEPNHATERQGERERLGIRDEETVLLYTGRLTDEKDPMLIAKAAELLRRTGAEVRLVCVGEGSQERTLRTFPFVHVMGPVSQARLAMLFRAADVAIWPRSMSSSQIDGLASGLPIVVSHKVGKPELFECGALSYHEGDAAALAEAVRPLLDPSLRARLGADAARIVRSKYSWDQVAEQRLNDYYAALAGAGTL